MFSPDILRINQRKSASVANFVSAVEKSAGNAYSSVRKIVVMPLSHTRLFHIGAAPPCRVTNGIGQFRKTANVRSWVVI